MGGASLNATIGMELSSIEANNLWVTFWLYFI